VVSGGAVKPLADPDRIAAAKPKSRYRYRIGAGSAEAVPSPEARIEAEASPVALSKAAGPWVHRSELRWGPKAVPPFEEPLEA
jgi:hypothetical protein